MNRSYWREQALISGHALAQMEQAEKCIEQAEQLGRVAISVEARRILRNLRRKQPYNRTDARFFARWFPWWPA